jgi:hypothetical protein
MYQWITILCILLFFLFVSINKKECFSVGGQGNRQGNENDISISSNLFLDSSMCCDDKDTCSSSDNCINSNCFYDPNKIKIDGNNIVYNCSGNCKYGKQNTGQLCISDTKNTIESVMLNANTPDKKISYLNFIKEYFDNNNKDNILCSKSTNCSNTVSDDFIVPQWLTNYKTAINSDYNSVVKKICDEYINLLGVGHNEEDCAELNIGTCE